VTFRPFSDLVPLKIKSRGYYSQSPTSPALFSLKRLPSRMYRLTICTERCPVWFMMDRSEALAVRPWEGVTLKGNSNWKPR
jgi:hypothetical protein